MSLVYFVTSGYFYFLRGKQLLELAILKDSSAKFKLILDLT